MYAAERSSGGDNLRSLLVTDGGELFSRMYGSQMPIVVACTAVLGALAVVEKAATLYKEESNHARSSSLRSARRAH